MGQMATMIVYVMQVSSDMALLAAYAGLFTSAFLAATIMPISSEAVLVGLMATGQGNLFVLFLVATIGNILGAVVNWFLASGIVEFGSRRWSAKNQRRYERARIMFRKYGAWTLLFAWLPVIGDAFTLVAGTALCHDHGWRLMAFAVISPA
ncbi:DedA family protein [Paraburkholderia aspalathi]|nr:DedA family protein [Paraburkholderia aspalathi]